MKCNVDVVRIRENSIQLNGWAIGKTPETEITYQVEDGAHQPIRFQYVATRRDDVSQIYFGRTVEKELGFDIQFPYERGKDYYLIAKGEGRKIRIKYNEELIRKRSSVAHKRMQKIRDLMNMETVRVCLDFWKENGLKALLVKSKHKLQGIDNDYDYGEWYSLTKPTAEELEEQCYDIAPSHPMLRLQECSRLAEIRSRNRHTQTGRSAWRTAVRQDKAASGCWSSMRRRTAALNT